MNTVDRAFIEIKRSDFLPDEFKHLASMDTPVPIGFGQTNSQPSTVRQMIQWLGVQPGEKILDVGSGSGWTTALLSVLVRPHGYVFAVERISELVTFGRMNCRNAGIKNVEFFLAGNEFGLIKHAPYHRILVSAAAQEFPANLMKQLVINGKLVIPVASAIWEATKITGYQYQKVEHPGYAFVPLV